MESSFVIVVTDDESVSVLRVTGRLTVELGVLVPYPEEGREARDHRRPSALSKHTQKVSDWKHKQARGGWRPLPLVFSPTFISHSTRSLTDEEQSDQMTL